MAQVQLPWGDFIEYPDPATPEEAARLREATRQFRERLRRGKTITMREAQEAAEREQRRTR
jgi:hypothetical protein